MGIRDAIRAIDAASRTASVVPSWNVQEKPDGYKFIVPKAKDLALTAGIPADRLALAAMAVSEVGTLPAQYFVAVIEVVRNEANALGKPVIDLLTASGKAPGHFGQQSGRYAATTQRPTARALAAVLQVETGVARGFAKNARRFFAPKAQDGGVQGGKPLEFNAIGLIRKRYAEGWKWVGPIGDPSTGEVLIDPYILMLLSKDGKMLLEDAEAAIEEGRSRWSKGGSLASLPVVGGGLLLAAGLAGLGWLALRG